MALLNKWYRLSQPFLDPRSGQGRKQAAPARVAPPPVGQGIKTHPFPLSRIFTWLFSREGWIIISIDAMAHSW
jgi:hypothetical protein